jgi:hypothetical protein
MFLNGKLHMNSVQNMVLCFVPGITFATCVDAFGAAQVCWVITRKRAHNFFVFTVAGASNFITKNVDNQVDDYVISTFTVELYA